MSNFAIQAGTSATAYVCTDVSNDRTPSQEARSFGHHTIADYLQAIEERSLRSLEKQLGEHAKAGPPFSGSSGHASGDSEPPISVTPASTTYSPSSCELVPSHAMRSIQKQQLERSRKRMRESSRASSPAISDVGTTGSAIRTSSVPRPSPSQLSSQT